MLRPQIATAALLALALAACEEPEEILPGERLTLEGRPVATSGTVFTPQAFRLPPAADPGVWTHRPGPAVGHLAAELPLEQVWSVPIGQGEDRRHRITATPVVGEGRVFTLDSRARVSATSTAGAALWSADLTPAGERVDDATGGGLALAGDTVFVTSGFGSLTALDAATGVVRWRQELGAPATGAPRVDGGQVYLVSADSTGWAIDARTGRILWTQPGDPVAASVLGGAAPAVDGRRVIFPFSSGRLSAQFRAGGLPFWSATVAGGPDLRVIERIPEVTGDPVLRGGRLYAGTTAGAVMALDPGSGDTLWRHDDGARGPLWIGGGSVFYIADRGALVRLDAATGAPVWQAELPFFTRDSRRRRAEIFAHYGPILAGGRLIVVSDDAMMRSFDPGTGALLREAALPAPAAAPPSLAGGTLYLVTEDGVLRAFR
jgi:outer membrane protein assembly factor BamB